MVARTPRCCRWLLKSAAYFELYRNARAMRFARAYLVEPLNADHEADVRRMVEGELAALELRDPDPAALEPVVVATARRALQASLDDLGSATFRADLASLRHETQYTRLFRS